MRLISKHLHSMRYGKIPSSTIRDSPESSIDVFTQKYCLQKLSTYYRKENLFSNHSSLQNINSLFEYPTVFWFWVQIQWKMYIPKTTIRSNLRQFYSFH
jgi:hypothetical protein